MGKTFTAEEFVNALSAGTLEKTLTLSGMVKRADEDSNTIFFSAGTSCGKWVRVPVAMIEQVEWLGKTPCADHEHDLVNLSLVEPLGEEAFVLASLLKQASSISSFDGQEKSFQDFEPLLVDGLEEESSDLLTERWNPLRRSGWRPPWTWSECAKCQFGTRVVLHSAVMAAIAAAGGGTGPSAIAAAQLALTREFGAAAAEAALSQVISGNIEVAAKTICRARGKC